MSGHLSTSGDILDCHSWKEGTTDVRKGSGRSPGEEHGNSFQYSCLNNPMDRGARWATVQRVTKSGT